MFWLRSGVLLKFGLVVLMRSGRVRDCIVGNGMDRRVHNCLRREIVHTVHYTHTAMTQALCFYFVTKFPWSVELPFDAHAGANDLVRVTNASKRVKSSLEQCKHSVQEYTYPMVI